MFYSDDGTILRQVNSIYHPNFDLLMRSGLYASLTDQRFLIPHVQRHDLDKMTTSGARFIQPDRIPFISYPSEWCFSQLKDAALLTLAIERIAIEHGMTLKDASAYNIQFLNGNPILIDTLSFEGLQEGSSWKAYRQFCRHFLAPLALMALTDYRLGGLFTQYIDGIPLDFAVKLLPLRSRFRIGLGIHLFAQARSENSARYTPHITAGLQRPLRVKDRLNIVSDLQHTVENLELKRSATAWVRYQQGDSYSPQAFVHKQRLIEEYVGSTHPARVLDLGANTGVYSRIAAHTGAQVVSVDSDFFCVEQQYRSLKQQWEQRILPLVIDVSNPTPAYGWAQRERTAFFERGQCDMILALALIHHLVITHGVPFQRVADFFSTLAKTIVVEFVPPHDPKVKQMVSQRCGSFEHYQQENFERDFQEYFLILRKESIQDSVRILYLFERR